MGMGNGDARETALILGASKGLGRAITEECRRRGMHTIEFARFSGSDEVARRERDSDEHRTLVLGNLLQAASTIAAVNTLRDLAERGKRPAHFFWVAGRHWQGPFEAMEDGRIVDVVNVNLMNALLVCEWVWDTFVHTRLPCTFTTIASTSGLRPRAHEAVYIATHHARVGFTRSLALEADILRRDGHLCDRHPKHQYTPDIHVRLFCPGGMRTEMFGAVQPKDYDAFMDPTKVARHIVARTLTNAPWIDEIIERDGDPGQTLR